MTFLPIFEPDITLNFYFEAKDKQWYFKDFLQFIQMYKLQIYKSLSLMNRFPSEFFPE